MARLPSILPDFSATIAIRHTSETAQSAHGWRPTQNRLLAKR